MSILIDAIRIAGFRGITNLDISLPRVTVLIGPNNSGKTSLLKALQLSLGDYARFLSDEDFHIDSDEKKATEILVDVRIVPVDENGTRTLLFNDEWATEFGDKIKAEANGYQFVAIRTRSRSDLTKGGFETIRFTLETWADKENWKKVKVKETKLPARLSCLPFISIEAQRDIHQELRDKSSFVGKVLSSVEYNHTDIAAIEDLIKQVNDETISKSNVLQNLKISLENLHHSIDGSGNTEITPFPKKIRDLSKHFSVHCGENSANSFSMEYHGMGTRSWASMLTVKAFIDLMVAKHKKESEPFFPIIAAEEPEAHLHPNAQKTLYRQLAGFDGQIIISTHSPYLVAMADIIQIRSLCRTASGISAHQVFPGTTEEEKKIVAREIMAKRGEILFSRAIILFEGVTEEQVLPAMFEIYAGKSLWDIGVSCISVGGKNYYPFVRLACCLGIPTHIISDNDGSTKNEVEKQMQRLKEDTEFALGADIFAIQYLGSGNNFEAEIISHGLRDEVIEALILCASKGSDNQNHRQAKYKELCQFSNEDILKRMKNSKAQYSGFLADILEINPNKKTTSELLPPAIINTFDTVKKWLT